MPERDGGVVHVWAAGLDTDPGTLARLRSLLEPAERERAGRFVFDTHRNRFTVMRAARRLVLAGHLGGDPGALRFTTGQDGKPSLAGPLGEGVEFSESRSAELAVYALRRGGRLGVDVEKLRAVPECDSIVASFASAAERAAWAAIAPAARDHAFLRWWTLKEAFLKALGTGLRAPLDRFTVAFAPGSPVALLDQSLDPAGRTWQSAELAPAPGFVGALMTDAPLARLDWHSWAA